MLTSDLIKRFFTKKKNRDFWKALKKPILVMAPMEDVTDYAFRQMFARFGSQDGKKNFVSFTEFVSSEGLHYASDTQKEALFGKLMFAENERPIVAQIFGSDPQKMASAAHLVEKLGFDGVDINMGCPDKSVEKTGAGAALIKNPTLAKKIVFEIKKAVKIPVSVKTRLGYSKYDKNWIKEILTTEPGALTVHLRTRNEMSKVNAHWELLPELLNLRDSISKDTILIANGDVQSLKDALQKFEKYAPDGIMVGRALFGNPLFFSTPKSKMSRSKKIELLKVHLHLFNKHLKGYKSYAVMKKHFKAYISDFKGAKALRIKLMETENVQEALDILNSYSGNS